jgi:nicotinamide mononucleotide transporter
LARQKLPVADAAALFVACAAVLLPSYLGWWSIPPVEAWGFATGFACVWLVVRQHELNWPVGMANNVLFFALFWRGRLYADMSLQAVYLGLGAYGWYHWHFGVKGVPLTVTRATRTEWLAIALAVPAATVTLRALLIAVNGAAPFWDSLTTVLCLVAQYLLTRKRLENWLFWIVADVVYIPLYLSRALPLTALLYVIFLGMCLVGARSWLVSLRETRLAA